MKEEKEFDNYIIEDTDDDVKRYTMWTIVPQTMVLPATGWEKAHNNGPAPEIATIRFLIPLCLMAGGADFFSLLYPGHFSFSTILVQAVITFCSFFIGYYLALVFSKIGLPKTAREFPSTKFGKLLTMTGIASLAFFHILAKALPMFDSIIEFLPLWTIFVIYQGMKDADVSDEKYAIAVGVVCLSIICSPYCVEWILASFEP